MVTKRCGRCLVVLSENEFTWHNAAHTMRDAFCKDCRSALKRMRYVPKHKIASPKLSKGVHDRMYDHLSDTQAAYIAGLVDGEGSIISSYPNSRCNLLATVVTMIHLPTINWLAETLDVGVRRHVTKQGNARAAWSVSIKAARSLSLLRRIRPFMITKAEEADVGIALGMSAWNEQHSGRLTPETVKRRNELGAKLRELKKREWR